MVKYGGCVIKCNECGKGCQVKTQIQRNAGWDYSIVTQSCSHGEMSIDMYTLNTYTPFGDPDEIKFKVKFIFAPGSGYTGTFERSFSRTSTEDGDDHDSKGCASAEAHFSGNGLGDYFKTAFSAGVNLVFAGNYCETRTFG